MATTVGTELPYRATLRRILDDVRSEFVVTGVVLLYMVLVLLDLVLYSDTDCGNKTYVDRVGINVSGLPYTYQVEAPDNSFTGRWGFYFDRVDMGFLIVFSVELLLRLYAYGIEYLFNFLNFLDAAIVVSGVVMQSLVVWSGGSFNLSFLRIVRLVRLVRLFIVMNKIQNARTAYKRTKYLKLGSPIDRVMELLTDMKGRAEDEDDEADIGWIMHLIASDTLYAVDLSSISDGGDAETVAFIAGEARVCGRGRGGGRGCRCVSLGDELRCVCVTVHVPSRCACRQPGRQGRSSRIAEVAPIVTGPRRRCQKTSIYFRRAGGHAGTHAHGRDYREPRYHAVPH